MYDQFYGFSERPFSLLPDPDFLFLGDKHRAALDTLEMAIYNHSGFCVISGEIGAGKTTLVRELLNRLKDDVKVGLVSNTHPSFGELMQWIMAAFGVPCETDVPLELHKRFIDYAIQRYSEGKYTLLIIDEAQNLSIDALEELRMLSNVNSGKDLVLQIILVGQSELREKLRQPELAQFAQRIGVDYYLGGLDAGETGHYIQHRVTHAGGAADLFTSAACRRVHELSQGIPRLVNRLCDLSLVYGYAQQREQIDAELVDAVAEEQQLGETMEAARLHAAETDPITRPVVPEIEPDPPPQSSPPPEVLADLDVETHREGALDPAPTAGKDAPADLHALVLNAEESAERKGERGALWLFVSVAVMVGVTAWASRAAWMPALQDLALFDRQGASESGVDAANVAAQARSAQQLAAQEARREQARREADERQAAKRLATQQAAEKAKFEQAQREAAEREAAARLAVQQAAEKARLEQARQEADEREAAARLAEQQAAENARLEQAQRETAEREAAARLAKQQAAEKARLEQAQRDSAARQKAARLAKQRAAEKARLEQAQRESAAREKAARLLEQRAAARVKLEQARIESAKRQEATRETVVPVSPVDTPAPEWSDEGDEPQEAETQGVAASVASEDKAGRTAKKDGFSANPCDGPTARFLSTCR